ncbi:MAG: hypothetical protein E7559_07405 [Ruminococcaceae bacterium]|nr:hypothetical protein [Oscillospiraceae bacterium]
MKFSSLSKSALAALLTLVIVFACGWMYQSGSDCRSFAIKPTPDPLPAAKAFLDCIKAGDYDGCSQYIYDCESINFSDPPESAAGAAFKKGLADNFDYAITGKAKKDGVNASVDMQLTCLDLEQVNEAYKQVVTEVAKDDAWLGVEIYSEEYALEAAAKAAEKILEQPEEYVVTRQYTLKLMYSDSRWQVVCDDELYQIILGFPNKQ